MIEKDKRNRADTVEIDLLSVAKLLLRKFYILLIAGVVVALGVYGYLYFFVAPKYESSVSFYVYNSSNQTTDKVNSGDLQAAESLATTYAQILASNSVLNAVVEDISDDIQLTKSELGNMVKASVLSDTQIIKVVVTSTDKEAACEIANSFAEVAPTEIVRITKAGSVEVVDMPEVATHKSSPNTTSNMAVGFILGVVIAAIFVVIRSMADKTIYLPDDIEALGLEEEINIIVLGTIPGIEISEETNGGWNIVKGGALKLEKKQ